MAMTPEERVSVVLKMMLEKMPHGVNQRLKRIYRVIDMKTRQVIRQNPHYPNEEPT